MAWLEQLGPRAADAPDAVRGRLLVLRALFAGMVGDLAVVRAVAGRGPSAAAGTTRPPTALSWPRPARSPPWPRARSRGWPTRRSCAPTSRWSSATWRARSGSCGSPRTSSTLVATRPWLGPVLSLAGLVLLARGDVRGGRRAVLDGAAVQPTQRSPDRHRLLARGPGRGGAGRRAPGRGGSGAGRRGRRSPRRRLTALAGPDPPGGRPDRPRPDSSLADQAEAAVAEGSDVGPPARPGPDAGGARRPAVTDRRLGTLTPVSRSQPDAPRGRGRRWR